MRELFPDWRAQGVTVCLHEHQGGFAFNQESVQGLADKCDGGGRPMLSGVEVTGIDSATTMSRPRSRPTRAGSGSPSSS